MPYAYDVRTGVHPLGIVLFPFLLVACAALGAACEAAVCLIPARWLSPLYCVFAIFAFGVVIVWSIRLGRIRGAWPAVVIAVFAVTAYVAGSLGAAYYIAPEKARNGFTWVGFFFERVSNGVPLNGPVAGPKMNKTGARVSGFFLIVLWSIEGLALLFTAAATTFIEVNKPFCDSCKSWATVRKWTCKRLLEPHWKQMVDLDGGIMGLLGPALRATSKQNRLEYRLDACNCGKLVALSALTVKMQEEGDPLEEQVYPPSLLTAQELSMLFEWAERIDPQLQSKRPVLQALQPTVVSTSSGDASLPPAEVDKNGEFIARLRIAFLNQEDFPADTNQIRVLRKMMKQGRFADVSAVLRSINDPTTRGIFSEAAVSWLAKLPQLDRWAASEPGNADARLLRGIKMVKDAWEARGGDFTPKNVPIFFSRLQEAEVELTHAAGLNPADGIAHAWLILCSMGLQRGVEASQQHFKESVRRMPQLRQPFRFLVQHMCSKWGGDDDNMLKFARVASARAPINSTIHSVLAEAHLEYGLSLERAGTKTMREYMSQPSVRAEIVEAAKKIFPASGYKPSLDSLRARELFAFVLWQAGERGMAEDYLLKVSPSGLFHYFCPWWMFWGSPRVSQALAAVRTGR